MAEAGHQGMLSSTIGAMFAATAGRFPEREAVAIPELGLRLSYRELRERVDRAARGFMALGIAKGEHVCLWSPNRAEWYETAYALWKLGAVVVSVNTLFRSAEFAQVLGGSDAATLVMACGFRDIDYIDAVTQLAPEVPQCAAGKIECRAFPRLKRIVLFDEAPRPGMLPFAQMLRRGSSVSDDELSRREQTVKPEDPATMIFTSGTTGFPKGAMLRHCAVLSERP